MKDKQADSLRDKLIFRLTVLIGLLRGVEESNWADWLTADLARIKARDQRGLDHLLSAFGGMGSLSDLFISPANGHQIDQTEVDGTNEDLAELRSTIHKLARELDRTES